MQLRYVKGETNVVVDALLRLPYNKQRNGEAVKESSLQQRVFEDQYLFMLDFGLLTAAQAKDEGITSYVRAG